MSKKILVILIFASVLIGSFCLAQRKLEIEYPKLGVPEVKTPTTTKTALPEYLKYVFTFAIMVSGLLAFGALIYGGFSYLTSAGNPSKMKEGQDQIMAGFLGLIIILSSYLILNTINPQLVILGKLPIEPGKGGVKIYTMVGCEDEEHPSFMVNQSMYDLTKPELDWGLDGKQIKSIKFLGDPGDLTVTLWTGKDFGPPPGKQVEYLVEDENNCKSLEEPKTYKSISLDWHLPGVYLYADDQCKGKKSGVDYVIFQSDSATLPEFDNKTKSIKFKYGSGLIKIPKDTPVEERDRILERECTGPGGETNLTPIGERDDNYLYQCIIQKYAAILHEDENYMGEAMLYDQNQGDDNCKNLSENLYEPPGGGTKESPHDIGVSSITVYLKPIGESTGEGVRLWRDKNYTGEHTIFHNGTMNHDRFRNLDNMEGYKEVGKDEEGKPVFEEGEINLHDAVTSIEMRGNYIALLFRSQDYKGECEVFMSSDPDLRNNRMGQCGWLGRGDCSDSFIVRSRK